MTAQPSVLSYSHDSQGLGHVKRNLALAHHIAWCCGEAGARGLIVSGHAGLAEHRSRTRPWRRRGFGVPTEVGGARKMGP